MVVSRRGGGVTGKTCSVCGVWKPLFEFAPDRSPGKFRGYRQLCCRACSELIKIKNKKAHP